MSIQTRKSSDFNNLGTIHNRAVADISVIDDEKRMIPFIIVSNDNAGLRYDWWEDEIYEERLDVNGGNMDSLNTMFKDHIMSVDNAIGRVENKRVENGQIKADVYFGSDEASQRIYNKFKERILTDVSIGYGIKDVVVTKRDGQPDEVLVTRFDIHELSAVWKGFDSKAKVGREVQQHLEQEVTSNEENAKCLTEHRNRKIWLAEKL